MTASANTAPEALIERLVGATNDHDLDAVVACFAPDYRNETPLHPERGFVGREQVRRNWSQIFALVPDVRVEVTRSAVDGDTVWTEWEHT
ncbi:MAG: nuclear transport factor 2 family protein, partial [Acidimicrobiia bacterium]